MRSEEEHLAKALPEIQAIYQRYRNALLLFGKDRNSEEAWPSTVSVRPTEKKYIGFRANRRDKSRRIANFHIGKHSFKIWFNISPGTIRNERGLARRTDKGYTRQIKNNEEFEGVIALLKQAYAHALKML